MFWNEQYKEKGCLWGNEPSELAKIASRYLREHISNRELSMLDIGCGYGRDALYLSQNRNLTILGIDVSEEAIDIASRSVPDSQKEKLCFRHRDFREFVEGRYDIVFSSNLYQLLREDERREFVKTVLRVLKSNGLLFLSTLSVADPQHSGRGTPIPEESGSSQDLVYLHLCAEDELEEAFTSMNIKELFQHEYDEHRVMGDHHHISWILIAENSTMQPK